MSLVLGIGRGWCGLIGCGLVCGVDRAKRSERKEKCLHEVYISLLCVCVCACVSIARWGQEPGEREAERRDETTKTTKASPASFYKNHGNGQEKKDERPQQTTCSRCFVAHQYFLGWLSSSFLGFCSFLRPQSPVVRAINSNSPNPLRITPPHRRPRPCCPSPWPPSRPCSHRPRPPPPPPLLLPLPLPPPPPRRWPAAPRGTWRGGR